MSTQIKDIAAVSFSIGSFNVAGQNIQTPIIVGSAIRQNTRTQSFSSLTGMLSANYLTTDAEYIAASDMLAQTSKKGLKVTSFKVGKKYEDTNAVESIAWDAAATGGTFTIDISKAGAASVTSGAINYTDNAAAIKAVIDAMSNVTSCTVAFNTGASQAGDAAGFNITFDGDPTIDFAITDADVSALTSVSSHTATRKAYATAVETATAGFTAIRVYDDDWYYFLPTTKDEDQQLLYAAAIESSDVPKYGMFTADSTNNSGIVAATSTDIAYLGKAAGYEKSGIVITNDTDNYANMCWFGATIPDKMWGINPCMYPISGITAGTFTAAEITNAVGKNCNRIESIGGYTIVPGTASGEDGDVGGISFDGSFIDYVVATDYLNAKVSEELYALFLANPKIPFNVDGSNLIKSVIEGAMQAYGISEGIVTAGSVVVTMPDLDTYSATKKAARWLDGVVGDGDAQGAINKVSVNFNLSV